MRKHQEDLLRKEAKENAQPKISKKSKAISGQTAQENKPIEERLIGYQKRLEGKKIQLEEKYKEQCSF